MSSPGFPGSVDVVKFAEQQVKIEGDIAFEKMPRLIDAVRDGQGVAHVRLEFDKDEQGRIIVTGCIEADVVLECQRCLEDMISKVSPEVTVCIVQSDEQAKNLPKAYDPYLMTGYELDVVALVEEELLLEIPVFSMHEQAECQMRYRNEAEDRRAEQEKDSNPFSVLAGLKVKK